MKQALRQAQQVAKRTARTTWRIIDYPWPPVRLTIIRIALRDLRASYGDLLDPSYMHPMRWDGPVTRIRYALMPRRMLLRRHFQALDRIEQLEAERRER